MNTQIQKALEMAIERLQISNELLITGETTVKNEQTIQACKEALAQPAQEPVAWVSQATLKHSVEYRNRFDDAKQWAEIRAVDRKTTNCDVPLYTHPAPAWQGLSDDEIEYLECLKAPPVHPDFINDDSWYEFARAIEQALKEKNNAL